MIKLNAEQKNYISQLENKVEKNIDFYKQMYSQDYLAELQHLVDVDFHSSLANAIAEDIFYGSDMEEIEVFSTKTKNMKGVEV